MDYQILNEEPPLQNFNYQARKLMKIDNAAHEIATLQQLTHFQVMKMCCRIAETRDENLNHQWRIHLQNLPHCLLDNLKSDFDHLCPSRSPLFAFDFYCENEQETTKYFPKFIKSCVKSVYGKNQGLDDCSKLFHLWTQFFDEKITKSVGPMLEFNSSIFSFLKSNKNCISDLCISYNSKNKYELPLLLDHLKTTLRNLRIFENRRLHNEVLDIIIQSQCQIESLRMNCLMKVDSEKILDFLRNQEKSLKVLNLTRFLHGSCFNYQNQRPGNNIDKIFKQISKMQNLNTLYVAGIDLVDKEAHDTNQDPLHRLHYLNIKDLYIHIRYIHLTENNIELKSIAQALSLTKIRFEYVTCQLNSNDVLEPKTALDNIHAISMELKINENNTGWIHHVNWKQLTILTVQDFDESKTYPWKCEYNLFSGIFFDEKWHPTFPQLKSVTIRLVKLPFPYCSLITLLCQSLNLLDLNIQLYNKDSTIQDFNAEDFKKQLGHRRLRLTHLRLLKRHAGIACHPIIPFQSLLDLLNSTPDIVQVEVNIKQDEVKTLMKKFNIEPKQSDDRDAVFDPDFDIASDSETDSDFDSDME